MQLIKSLGCKAGLVLNPATPIESLEWLLEELDLVLVMSVNPGFGGQAMIPSALAKVRRIRAMIDKANLDITWLRDESLDDASSLPPPGVLAAEIVEELEAALAQFTELAASLPVDDA